MGLFDFFSSYGVWKEKRHGSSGIRELPDDLITDISGIRELPDDLITDILSRLPAECVLKYRRVCKRWLALTCTPHFAQLHLKRSATATSLLLQMICYQQGGDKLYLFQLGENNTTTTTTKKKKNNNNPPTLKRIIRRDVVIAERVYDLRIRASCDGFLVFQDVRSISRFVVCNIVTREQVTLDSPINIVTRERVQGSSVLAMFLHPVTKEYTILFQKTRICVGTRPYGIRSDLYLYGFTSKLWRQISSFHHIPKYVSPPVVLNNTLHWMTGRRSPGELFLEDKSHCDGAIFMFDTISEEFRVMPHPGNKCRPFQMRGLRMFINETEGTLCLFWIQPSQGVADIWALEDYDNWCWAKKKTIVIDNIIQRSPIYFISNSNHELLFQSGTRFYKVNIDKNQQQPEILVDETRKEFKRKIINGPVVIFPFTKSFVSLKPSKYDQIHPSIHPSPEEN